MTHGNVWFFQRFIWLRKLKCFCCFSFLKQKNFRLIIVKLKSVLVLQLLTLLFSVVCCLLKLVPSITFIFSSSGCFSCCYFLLFYKTSSCSFWMKSMHENVYVCMCVCTFCFFEHKVLTLIKLLYSIISFYYIYVAHIVFVFVVVVNFVVFFLYYFCTNIYL